MIISKINKQAKKTKDGDTLNMKRFLHTPLTNILSTRKVDKIKVKIANLNKPKGHMPFNT